MFHRYFKGRIAGYVIEMEQEASALLDALDGRPGVMNTAPRAAGAQAGAAPVTVKG
jgi:biopolymer transport protein ExbB